MMNRCNEAKCTRGRVDFAEGWMGPLMGSCIGHSLLACLVTLACCWGLQPAMGQLIDAPQLLAGDKEFSNDLYVREGEGLEELRKLEGQPAKEIAVAEWRGESTSLSQLRGKIVVLDFWATWCGPCMAAIPKNVALVDKYRDQGVELIGLHDAKSGWDSVDKVISEKEINYPVALDNMQGDSGETTQGYNLMFWPTYFVIDRAGIVRGAGIRPDKVEEVVLKLLGEAPAAKTSQLASTFPDVWFLGGTQRMAATQGAAAPALNVAQWVNHEPQREEWGRQVKVIQFFRPELSISVNQLNKLQIVAERFQKQGVAFVAVCDSRSSADKVRAMLAEQRVEIPIAVDATPAVDQFAIGATAEAMGVKFAPATLVVDRRGMVRASGLKTDFLDKVLNTLLAEPLPTADEMSAAVVSQLVASSDEVVAVTEVVTAETTESSAENGGVIEVELQAALPEEAAPPSPAAMNQ